MSVQKNTEDLILQRAKELIEQGKDSKEIFDSLSNDFGTLIAIKALRKVVTGEKSIESGL